MRYFQNIVIILTLLFFISCSKDNKEQLTTKTNKQEVKQEESENPPDSLLSPEEKFSSSIMEDFLDSSEDEELQGFLEDELFKYAKDYRGVSVLQLTNASWFVTLENNKMTKNFLVQKFVDFNTNDYYFDMKETSLNLQDVISAANMYRYSSAGKEEVAPKPEEKK